MAKLALGKTGLAIVLAAVAAILGTLAFWLYRDATDAPRIDKLVVDLTGTNAGAEGAATGSGGYSSGTASSTSDSRTGVVYRLDQVADGLWA